MAVAAPADTTQGQALALSRLRRQSAGNDRVDPDGGIAQAPRGVHGDEHSDHSSEAERRKSEESYERSVNEEPKVIFGVSKIMWAMVANIIALLAFIACIPCVLTIAKRRRVT